MRKNVASQVVGAQMVNATTGAAFTSTTTCYVTGDGGTQALGATGAGVCTHEGNGFHTYVPTQGETNRDHIAFTFIGTGAIPVTIQVYTKVVTVANEVLANAGFSGLVAGACVSGSTTTQIRTNLTEATNDHYKNRVITFTSGVCTGQTARITAYDGGTKYLTVTQITDAPANTDAFVIS